MAWAGWDLQNSHAWEAATLLVQKLHDYLNAQDLKVIKKNPEKDKASQATIKTETLQDFNIHTITENLAEGK